MTHHTDAEILQERVERRARQRNARRKPKMKVSGASVKKLQRIIISRGR